MWLLRHEQSPKHFMEKDIDWWKKETCPADHPLFAALRKEGVSRILEVGPGRGAFTFSLRDLGTRVVAIEINPRFIEYCRRTADCRNVQFVFGNGEVLPFRDESFDAVVCVEVIMHMPNPENAFEEMARVTKPGGLAFVSFLKKYTKYHFKKALMAVTRVYELKHGKGSFDYRFDTLPDMQRYAGRVGLEVERVYAPGSGNPSILYRKSARGRSSVRD